MDELSNIAVYVWEGIENVKYVSITDKNGGEIICPVTAKTRDIASKLSYTYNETINEQILNSSSKCTNTLSD